MTALTVNCLGDLVAQRFGVAIPKLTNSKALALWVYVALGANPCPRAKLAALFWGDLDDAAAKANLRQALMRLRQLLPEHIEADNTQVAVPRGAGHLIDIQRMHEQLQQDPLPVETLLPLNPQDLFIGLQLRNAPQVDDWITRQRLELAAAYVTRLSHAAREAAAADPVLAIELHRRCLSFEPWDEARHRALMELFVGVGDRSAALAQFETCRLALASELDVTPDRATLDLCKAIRAGSGGSAPPPRETRADTGARVAFPEIDARAQLPNVSRGREQQHVLDLLLSDSGRIVSIVGPGGAGKTHLATEIGRELREHFAGRVHFVPLVDLQPADDFECEALLVRRVLEVLAISFVPGSERAALEQAVENVRALLVFDNFERLTAGRSLLAKLSLRSRELRILVTTRHQLGLAAEWIIRIDGLDYPDADADAAPASASDFPAVQLFDKVARRLDGRFDLQRNLPAVVRICQLVDGYPLALILAARWLPTLDCGQIAVRLSSDLSLIRDPSGERQPDRHRSMAAVLSYSWELLDADERAAFAALSVFPGAFAATIAEQISGCAMDTLARLESKSLVRRSGESLLEIHPLLRSVGEARLAEMGEWSIEVRERHARCFMAALTEAFEEFVQHDQRQMLHRLSGQISDVSLAFRHWRAVRPVAEWAPQVAALWMLYRLQGWFREGAALMRTVLGTPDLPGEFRTRWRLWLTEALHQLGAHEECHTETVAALRHHGEPVFEGEGSTGAVMSECARLLLPMRRTTRAASPLTDDIARLYNRLAQVCFFEGRRGPFVASLLRSVTLDSAGKLPSHFASAALSLAYTPFQGRARHYARRAAEIVDRADCLERAWTHELLCLYYLSRGVLPSAEHHGAAGQKLYWELKQYRNWGECTSLLANTRLLSGDLQGATADWTLARDQGAKLQESASHLWGYCAMTFLALRGGVEVDLDEYQRHEFLLTRFVDPNSQLLYHGIHAWLLARAQRTEQVLRELRTFQRVVGQASMLSIYALNGFVGHVMALSTLQRAGLAAGPLAELGPAGLRQLAAFARMFPGARPTAMYLQAAWLDALGHAARARRMRERARRRLVPGCQRESFDSWLAGTGP